MQQDSSIVAQVMPIVVIAVVLLLRFRNVNRARHLKPAQLWIVPAVIFAVACFFIASSRPDATGWLVLGGGVLVGAAVGWQRARLMRLHLDEDGRVMMRQSPAAILFILAILAARRVIFYESGAGTGPAAAGEHLTRHAMLLTDGALGFALGMIVALRLTLFLAARQMIADGRS